MAFNLTSGAGAGGAVKGLQDVLEQRFVAQKLAEAQRQAQAEEAFRAQEAQRAAEQQQFNRVLGVKQLESLDQARKEAAADRDEQRAARSNEFDVRMQENTFNREQAIKKEKSEQEYKSSEAEKERQNRKDIANIAASNRGQGNANDIVEVKDADPETGKERIRYLTRGQAAALGTMTAPAGRGQPTLKEKIADLSEAERLANAVLERGNRIKWRGVGPLGGRISSAMATGGLRIDPEEERLRNDLGNLFSLISHERFGAALTPQEIGRAQSFLAEKTDPAERIQSKMNALLEFVRSKRGNMGAPGAGVPVSPGSQSPTQGPQEFDYVPGKGLVPRSP